MVVRKLCNLATPPRTFAGRTHNRPFKGVVVRTASQKTVMVKVRHETPHRIYGNFVGTNKLYMCHDEHELCNIGDEVRIQKCRPKSKRKHWKIHSWIKREPSALWFKIHPGYNLDSKDRAKIEEQYHFDYQRVQEAFDFGVKEKFDIQDGIIGETKMPERIKRTLDDQLLVATLLRRGDKEDPKKKLEKAKDEYIKIREEEIRKREAMGISNKWSIDDEPGTVTVARMKILLAKNEIEAKEAEYRSIIVKNHEKLRKIKELPDEYIDGYMKLETLMKKE